MATSRSCGSANGTVGSTCSASRAKAASRRLLPPSMPMCSTSSGSTKRRGSLYVVASPEKATDRYLYRSRLDGTGAPERVSPAAAPGTHGYDLAPGGRLAFHTYSRLDQPPAVDVVELPSHRSLRTLTDTSKLVATLAPVLQPAVEFFTVDIGEGVTLDGWMLKPSTSIRRGAIPSSCTSTASRRVRRSPIAGAAAACCFTVRSPKRATSC